MNEEEVTNHEESRTGAIHAVFSFVIALALLLAGIGSIIAFVVTKPEPEKNPGTELVPTVRARPIEEVDHPVVIETQGVVRSVREVSLAAEVAGRVVAIDPQLIEGGRVEEGQVLVEIDSADYQAAVARARSNLADAELALAQEQARRKQAELDWAKLGRGEPGDLVLRKPQIIAAEARIDSARAEVERAERDLSRTSIEAPFDARVRRAQVEVGAVVSPGAPVAELYSGDQLEVRLPFSLLDYGYLDPGGAPEFSVSARIGGEEQRWPARMERLEGEVERSTLSGYGIARVLPNEAGGLPPVGLFVEARVPGRTLEDAVQLPRAAVRGRNEVWVVGDRETGEPGDESGADGDRKVLAKRRVDILRSGRDELIVTGDFAPGDMLVLTRLAAPLVGMEVAVETDGGEGAPSADGGNGGREE